MATARKPDAFPKHSARKGSGVRAKDEPDDVTDGEERLDPNFLKQLSQFLRHQGYELTKSLPAAARGIQTHSEPPQRGRSSPPPTFQALRRADVLPSRKAPPKGRGRMPWTLVEIVDKKAGDAANYHWLTMRDQTGHLYKWHGSSPPAHSIRPGETTLMRGTILKTIGDTTWLTRCWLGGEDRGHEEGDS